jgi:hypothetical protein
MFPPEVQLIFNARIALQAAEQGDQRFDLLVTRLMERCSLNRDDVIRKIGQLAQGNTSI